MNERTYFQKLFVASVLALIFPADIFGQSGHQTIIPEPWTLYAPSHYRISNRMFNNDNADTPYTGNITIPPYVIEKKEGNEKGAIMMVETIHGKSVGPGGGWIQFSRTRAGYSENGSSSGTSSQYGAFYKANIDTLWLPSTLKRCWGYAFEEANVKVLVCAAQVPPIMGDVLTKCELIVPTGCAEAYRQAENWNRFASIKEGAEALMPEQVVSDNGAWYRLQADGTGSLLNSDDAKLDMVIPDAIEFYSKRYPVTALGVASVNRHHLYSITLGSNISHFDQSCIQDMEFYEDGRQPYSGDGLNDVRLEAIHVSADNPNYSSVNGGLYSKNMKSLIYLPYVQKTINDYDYISRYYTIPDGVTTIKAHAFPYYYMAHYRNSANSGYVVVPPSVALIEEQNVKLGFNLIFISATPPKFAGGKFEGIIYTPKDCLYNYLDVYPYSTMNVKEGDTEAGMVRLLTTEFDAYWNSQERYYQLLSIYERSGATQVEFPSWVEYASMSGPVKAIQGGDVRNENNNSARGGVREIIIPEGVEYLSLGKYEALRTVHLPSTLKELGASCFNGCKYLKNLEIPDGVHTIGERTFKDCTSLEDLSLPTELTQIGKYAFESCTFKNILLPADLREIGEEAFSKCKNLKSITLPASLKRLGSEPFDRCEALIDVYMESATPPELFSIFSEPPYNYNINWKFANLGVPSSATLHVPVGSKATYEASPVWGGFSTIIEDMPENNSSGIGSVRNDHQPFDVYDLQGRKVLSRVKSLQGLQGGIYIINGKKMRLVKQ